MLIRILKVRTRVEDSSDAANFLTKAKEPTTDRKFNRMKASMARVWTSKDPWYAQFEWSQSPNGELALRNAAFGLLRPIGASNGWALTGATRL